MSHKRNFNEYNDRGNVVVDGSAATSATQAKPKHDNSNHHQQKQKVKSNEWNFVVDYNDHFETPPVAYSDLLCVLSNLCTKLNKPASELIIYDPYWCKGNMVAHLAKLGYTNVINKNRDFYNDIRCKMIPAYDILVTNPPYSGEHKVKLLSFLSSRSEPFALLLPAYTATKSYWKDFTTTATSVPSNNNNSNSNKQNNNHNNKVVANLTAYNNTNSSSSGNVANKNCFYVMPPDYYEYLHPEGTGKDLPPFYSCWFVGGFAVSDKQRIIQFVQSNARRANNSNNGSSAGGSLKRLPFPALSVLESVDAMVRLGIVTAQRPNPKLRKKLKNKLMGNANSTKN